MNYTISVTRVQNEKFCISLTYNSKRYKYYNGKPIGLLKSPNKLPVSERRAAFEDLKLDYQLALRNGWTPESVKNDKKDQVKLLDQLL